MSWGPTLYVQLLTEEAIASLVSDLDIPVMPDGSLSTGNQHFALVAIPAPWIAEPTYDDAGELLTLGEREPGHWFMGRINDEWPGAENALTILQTAGVLREIAKPPVVWA